jgi:hypothetical protein
MHHGVHLFFSLVTIGLWAVSWLSIYIMHRRHPWRCEHCGWNRPDFNHATSENTEIQKAPET